ncbi:ankyrin repeat domain-containing protein 24 [Alosa sapidissima]|uniref:ankyrin repeat domain-containing protein 24 n=1 Tax=Alosa sapidissima TaxID=34773 RepID=UPI001C0826A1|nr:ankyrin repeat domain-containing protein 24 [Alosa sapidissima]
MSSCMDQALSSLMKRFCACLALLGSQDWNKTDEKLLQAVEQNEPDKVSALIVKKGLNPSKLDAEGKSAFHLCASRGRADCLEVIISHGVDINITDGAGFNALHLAAKNGQPECLKRLLQERMPVDSTDTIGRTALHHAAISGCLSCTETLWDFKASLDAQDGDGATALLLGAQMSRVDLCAFLLDRGANANIQDQQGRSALMIACESDSVETVEALLRGGANPQQTDVFGRDASHYGVATGNQRITQLLQNGGKGTAAGKWTQPPAAPPPVPGGSMPRKRKAPPPPRSPLQAAGLGLEPQATSTPKPSPGENPRPRARSPGENPRPRTRSPGENPRAAPRSPRSSQSPDNPAHSQQPNLEQRSFSASQPIGQSISQAEDEEVFEEIRRLRLERGRLLQKIKVLEQQQHSALTALEELAMLRARLEQAEAERDRLQTELEELRAAQSVCLFSDSEESDGMLDFPGAEKLLSRQSRAADVEQTQEEAAAAEEANPGEPGDAAELQKQVEELTAQNAELVLKVQMLEMFEKDDTNMETSGPDFVPTVLYESLRKEYEELQEKYSCAQAAAEASSIDEPGSEGKPEEVKELGEKTAEGESSKKAEESTDGGGGRGGDAEERVRILEVQLASTQTELKELREQVQVGVFSVEQTEAGGAGRSSGREEGEGEGEGEGEADAQQLRERVRQLEQELAERRAPATGESNAVQQLREEVDELQRALEQERKASAERRRDERKKEEEKTKREEEESEAVRRLKERVRELENRQQEEEKKEARSGEGELTRHLQAQLGQLEAQLRSSVPRAELDEVRVTMGLQLDQLARERAQVALRLNDALLDLERLRPPAPHGDEEDEEGEDEDERSEGSERSERSIISEHSLRGAGTGQTLAAVRAELEAARQEASQALDSLWAEREGRAQDALRLQDSVPLVQHQEALEGLSEQLAQTAAELQREAALRCQAQAQAARLQEQLQDAERDLVSREEHEKVKAELQRSLEESEGKAQAAQEALSEKETELKELKSQKAKEQGLVSQEDHEAQRLSLQAEINALTARMADLQRKHEKTCTEVFQVQREALFNKSERQAAEAQVAAVQKQLEELQAQSSHVQQLHQDIQHSQGLIKEKDRKITELSKDVFRLKEALGALSPPLGGVPPPGNPGQQVALQNRVSALTQQLQDCERKHKTVVAIYRSHLLAAVQGRMDEEVQALLLQILRMSSRDQSH